MKIALILVALAQDEDVRSALSRVAAKVRDRVAPAVVAIYAERTEDPEGQGGRGQRADHQDYYNRPRAPCTGTIVSKDGYILTSAFNVSGTLKKLTVVTGGDTRYEARVLGSDPDKDVALLKIDATDLPTLEPARVADLKTGDFVFLVGRAPEPDSPTVNFGIISALHRFGGSHLQTDAECNYGNVGGPLVTADGKLIGIMTHIKPRAHWGQSSGVGFCFKNDGFDRMIEKLKKGQSLPTSKNARGAYLGVILGEGVEEGVQVSEVIADSPAEEAGLKQGDVLLEIDGAPVKSIEEFNRLMKSKAPGTKVKIKVKRGDKVRELTATLQEEP